MYASVRKLIIIGIALAVMVLVISLLSCQRDADEKIQLRVICAGSLIVPFKAIETAYEELNPHVDVLTQGHGSIQVIRRVTELGHEADIVAVADHSLIPPMMYDVQISGSDDSYASWYVRFASNTLGLAYTPGSKYADEINAANWYEILSRPDVRLGMSDPRFDACGYRAMMACWLAELLYDDGDIFENVLGSFEYPITFQLDNRRCTILVPEVVRPHDISIRGSSIVLLGILASGDIDYAFEYKSVARQHDLHFLEFPPEINLGSDDFERLGYDLRVKLDYQRFASVIPEFTCQMIYYGVTIPENSPQYEEAVRYLEFMLGPDGAQIFADLYQPYMSLVADNHDRIPEELQLMVSPWE
ncbi:MAG: tungstate ABC transporter substrate-binding protein WtpA [Dehalococcoidia bacterium]